MSTQIIVAVSQGIVAIKMVAAASATGIFFQIIGGSIWINVDQNIFADKLIQLIERS